jgi:CelD/BcsL family acetyltransferase involved in cellulose biosynthesis
MNGLALTPEWLLAWWREFGGLGDRQLRLMFFHRGERLIGLAPLLWWRIWYAPGIPFRRLEFLATGEPKAHAICSDYLNVIAERGSEFDVALALAHSVQRGELGEWDEVVLSRMAGDDVMPELLREAFASAAGLPSEKRSLGEAPYIPLPPRWEDYLKELGKKNRHLLRNSRRQFERWAGGDWHIERASSLEEVRRARQTLIALHRQRWGDGGTFRSPRFLRFHDTIMEWLAGRGGLELLTLSVRGEPVAALYNLIHDNKVYYYQCGRRLDVPCGVRPGGVLLGLAIEASIAAGRREFDFLLDAARYKRELALASRTVVEIRVARPSLRERLRQLAAMGRRAARVVKRAFGFALALAGRQREGDS